MPLRAHRRTAVAAAVLSLVVGLAGCASTTGQLEDYTGIEQGNASPASAPSTADPEGGEVVPAPGSVSALVAVGDRVLAQVDGPPALEIARVEGTRWIPEATVELPADAGTATAALDGTVLVPYGDGVVVVSPDGDSREIAGLGPVTAAAVTTDGRLLTGAPGGEVVVRDSDGAEQHRVRGLTSVDRISVARDGSVTAFSRPDTVIASIDLDESGAGPLLRAGRGAGMLGEYGDVTIVASDTVGDTLLVYSTSPIRLHQQFPVAAAPWAVAGDPTRDVVWVTSTGTNTIQAYDLGDGTGVRRAEIATVRQPDSLVVTESGTVVVGSADGAGLHLVRPELPEPSS